MITKVLPFSMLTAQGRWKVEFFVSDGTGIKSNAFPLVKVKDVLSERRLSLDPQQFPNQLFNYIGLEHVHSITGDLVDEYSPREGREVLSRSKVFFQGDVLYGRLRPSLNKVFVAESDVLEGICSSEFYVLIPNQKLILPFFARSLLASRYIQDVVKSMTTGSALPRLGLDDLLEIEIPLPPLDIQREYEKAIVRQSIRRRELQMELRHSLLSDLESFVAALDAGGDLCFSSPSTPNAPQVRVIKLPDMSSIAKKHKGAGK